VAGEHAAAHIPIGVLDSLFIDWKGDQKGLLLERTFCKIAL
jgi:hypothetical protein